MLINDNYKKLLASKKFLNGLSEGEKQDLEYLMYSGTSSINCVDAVHVDYYENESEAYTWFIPDGFNFDIEIGDTLVVEQVVGIGLAFVKAVSRVYPKTKEEHEENIHPYCPVISNLGVRL